MNSFTNHSIRFLAITFFVLAAIQLQAQRNKIYTGVQTTYNNTVKYGTGVPTFNPSGSVYDTLAQNYLDTTANVAYMWGVNEWIVTSAVRQNDPPLPINTVPNPDINYKDAIWIDANDNNNEYYFDEAINAWTPLGHYRGSSAPADIAATGTAGAVSYTKGLWSNTSDGKIYFWNGSSWSQVGNVGTGTANKVTKWATTSTLGDSQITDNGTNVVIERAASANSSLLVTTTGGSSLTMLSQTLGSGSFIYTNTNSPLGIGTNGSSNLTLLTSGIVQLNGYGSITKTGTAASFPAWTSGGNFIEFSASGFRTAIGAGTGNGTVTSVALTMPSGFTVSNSPVTGAGTLTVTTSLSGVVKASGGSLTAGNVNLGSEVTGNLPVTNLNAGIGASASTCWLGNGTWGIPEGTISGSGTANYFSKWTATNTLGNSTLYNNAAGGISIGTTSAGNNTTLYNYFTQNAINRTILSQNELHLNTSSTGNEIFEALRNILSIEGSGSSTSSSLQKRAMFNYVVFSPTSSGNHYEAYASFNKLQTLPGSTGTITNLYGQYIQSQIVGATVTNLYGLYVDFQGALSVNNYGLYINSLSASGLKFGIYQAGINDNNYFSGNTSFGNPTSQNAQVFVQGNSTTKPAVFVFTNLAGYADDMLKVRASIAGASTFNLINAQTSNGGVTQFLVRGDGQAYFNGNVGIGNTSPGEKLDVTGNVKISGVLKNADGTNALPSFTFFNDLDVGLYRPTTNTLAATVGGTEGWRINSTGFGVFTTPSYGLDINTTGGARIPGGTTAQRPTNAARVVRYNSDTETLEWANGTSWFNTISGSGSANRVAYWSGGTGLTSSGAFTFNGGTGQLTLGNYTSQSAFTGTSVAELHVTSSGAIITKTPRDTVYVKLTAVPPGTSITQTAGFDFYHSVYLVPADMNGYQISRASYAIANSTATSGTLTVGLRQYSPTNTSVASNLMAVSFNGATSDVRKESTSALTLSTGQWIHAEVHPSITGTLNNVNEGLIITLTLVK